MALGRFGPAALGALLLRHEKTTSSIGEFLVQQGIMTRAMLEEALNLQQQLQVSMTDLLRQVNSEAIAA